MRPLSYSATKLFELKALFGFTHHIFYSEQAANCKSVDGASTKSALYAFFTFERDRSIKLSSENTRRTCMNKHTHTPTHTERHVSISRTNSLCVEEDVCWTNFGVLFLAFI